MSKNYKYIRIRLASPEEIKSWSHGEVKKHETINYRTLKPEPDGLFCERIFGPVKDYQCSCGKSKRSDVKGKICDKCGVEITESKVRRERMGHIELASPVVHVWYLRNVPSKLAILLDLKTRQLEEVVYLVSYIVLDPKNTNLKKGQILSEQEYQTNFDKYQGQFKAGTGAEAILELLKEIDLEKEVTRLRKKLKTTTKQKKEKVIKRLEVMESFYYSDNKPEWMVLKVLPVIPPDIRPMVQLDGGRFATTDLNDLYRRILNRNTRLKKIQTNAISLIVKNEKRLLQEAVDSLIDNSKRGKKGAVSKNRLLKSLSDMLRGKQGRFRQNLLGKRVDYSGRSVIIVGPDLKMYQCGIPKEMALTLFKPFVLRELINAGNSISAAKKICDEQQDSVWKILEEVIREHPVLLNRAPTLHRLGIQAFEPILIEGKAIRLHPLVTTAFNADFDGDQMAVHVPLSHEAQAEARLLMLASNNILNPKDGKPVVAPSQDMVLGNYYLTLERQGKIGEGKFFKDFNEAELAYKNNEITLHSRIFIDPKSLPSSKFKNVNIEGKYLYTTVGKMIFNNILPVEFPYLNEPTESNLTMSTPDKYFLKPSTKQAFDEFISRAEVDPFKKKYVSRIIAEVFKRYKITETSKMLDKLKDLGFHYSTVSGITISASDVTVYEKKEELINIAETNVANINGFYKDGLLTSKEKSNLIEREWARTRNEIQDGLWKDLQKEKDNHIFMMADSGSRGSASNFAQLAGMRGLMNNTTGDVIEVPVKANFREGLSVSEFFISTHGARKGSTDTALKTAESGYLTRRLVDVSQDVIVSEDDCGTYNGFEVADILADDGKVIVKLKERLVGRYLAKDVVNANGEVIATRNQLVDEDLADIIDAADIEKATIRSNITCNSKIGVCIKCYGRNLATNTVIEVGEAVGTIAAQSIGEPGTQLTMRTFHTGGVASTSDITQGLPRIQELFESRSKPKGKATMSEVDGVVKSITASSSGVEIMITDNSGVDKKTMVEATAERNVEVGSVVKRGDRLTKGPLAPAEILRIKDTVAVQTYIIEEVQKVYRSQGVEISDKHIEIIVKQMTGRFRIDNEGSSSLLPGRIISTSELEEAVMDVLENNGTLLPTAKPLVLGITKAAMASKSFLSAASFQQTTKILTDAAIKGKADNLVGLKENILIGGLIPAGTGVLVEESFECEHRPLDDMDDSLDQFDFNESEYKVSLEKESSNLDLDDLFEIDEECDDCLEDDFVEEEVIID
ncbi:MAG: DNA-directed RNA polymerase subunit beta' [Anaeroplasmataceae bacterium]